MPKSYAQDCLTAQTFIFVGTQAIEIIASQEGALEIFPKRDEVSFVVHLEFLDTRWFGTQAEAKDRIAAWRKEYNESRHHRTFGETTPKKGRVSDELEVAALF